MGTLGFDKTDSVYYRCVEDCNEAIMVSDTDGNLVYVNPAWSKTYGYSREEAIGRSPRLLHSGIQPPEFYQMMWAQIRDPKVGHWKGELVNKAKDGTLIPVLLTITPVKGDEGKVTGYMGFAVDMTYMKEMEAKVAHQDRLASIGTLASGLAHEIGTPLGVVRGRAEFLMMKATDPDAKRELEVITSQTDRISKLIRSLLRISRGFSDAVITEVSVGEVAQEVLTLLGQHFNNEGIRVEIEVPAEQRIRADSSRMEQVFLNLMMNSLHAIQKAKSEGKVGPHLLRIYSSEEKGRTLVRVEDSGCGISAEHMRHLFKPFFTTKDVGKGTGLGLAIVSQLLSEMDSRISVVSQVGEGAVFTMEFP